MCMGPFKVYGAPLHALTASVLRAVGYSTLHICHPVHYVLSQALRVLGLFRTVTFFDLVRGIRKSDC